MNEQTRMRLSVVIVPSAGATKDLLDVLEVMPADVDDVVVVRGGDGDGTADMAAYLWPSLRIAEPDHDGTNASDDSAASGGMVVTIEVAPVRRLADRELTGLLTLLHDIENLTEPDPEQEADEAGQFSRWRTTAATTREAARPAPRELIGR
jgi:hypothetical protein